MKKLLFILTYSEGQQFVTYYKPEVYNKYFKNDVQIVVLDNGNQGVVREWSSRVGALYFATENNLGTTGGYNFFIRLGEMFNATRIAVMQADVLIHDSITIDLLFNKQDGSEWSKNDFVYWPQLSSSAWHNGIDPDVGQFFSLDPIYFLENDFLCDENYTVTHFESIDLYMRITDKNSPHTAKINNLMYMYYPGMSPNRIPTENTNGLLYTICGFSDNAGELDKWFLYNFNYFKDKWSPTTDISAEDAFELFKQGHNFWGIRPWDSENWHILHLNKRYLKTQRNTDIGQLPYPVEWEINRFYKEHTLFLQRFT
jgi:hypothetical protein